MAEAAEFLYESCTCDSGMRNGERCADCGGRGIVSRGTTIKGGTVPAAEDDARIGDDEGDGLEQLNVTDLRAKSKDLGLPTGGTKAVLIARIRELAAEDVDDGEESDGDASDDVSTGDGADA